VVMLVGGLFLDAWRRSNGWPENLTTNSVREISARLSSGCSKIRVRTVQRCNHRRNTESNCSMSTGLER
jgi:hypothetical protein